MSVATEKRESMTKLPTIKQPERGGEAQGIDQFGEEEWERLKASDDEYDQAVVAAVHTKAKGDTSP